MSAPSVLFVHVGSMRHGVTRYGATLADAASRIAEVDNHWLDDPADPAPLAEVVRCRRPAVVHLHFTDQLYGSSPALAARRCCDLLDAAPAAATIVTLHDLPTSHGSEPTELERRRAYQQVAERADAVVVCSEHEAQRLLAFARAEPNVISHYVERRQGACGVAAPAAVGVLGYIYPGKGHAEVLDACARLDVPTPVIALGGPSPRHHDLADDLVSEARSVGVELLITGWIADHLLDERLANTAVPVVPHRDVSASGSLATWLSADRCPLVAASEYTREVAAAAPGCLTLYDGDDPDALASAIDRALTDPDRTRQDLVPPRLRPDHIAREHLELFRTVR